MKCIIDHHVVKIVAQQNPDLLNSHQEDEISFGWFGFLEYLRLGSILTKLSLFDQNTALFEASISTLNETGDQDSLFYIYDSLFTENLNQVIALPEINPSFLLQALKEKEAPKSLTKALSTYESALVENPSKTMHDLILYLAWDRMCVCMANLFNVQSTNPTFIHGVDVLKGCLIESYQHIKQQGSTHPPIYRMLEALFFYQLREENIPKHTDDEWALLSQSFHVLNEQNEFSDIPYINPMATSEDPDTYLTLESLEKVNSRLLLAECLIGKIKTEVHNWSFLQGPKKSSFTKVEHHD